MTMLWYALGVLLMAVGIAASIALHEIGHLVPAKRFGVRVPQYMVGFGPTIWSTRRGETEYGVKAIPLGGYIRMIGMFPPRPGDAPGTVRSSSTGRLSQLIDEARRASAEEVRSGDEDRVFYKLSAPRKLVVMLGGPTMNLVIAVVLLTLVVTTYGVPQEQPGASVAAVSECVVASTELTTERTCTASDPKTPAFQAGLRPGDEYVSIAGRPISATTDVGAIIRDRAGQPTAIVVRRDGAEVTLTATPILNTLPELDATGAPVLAADGTVATVQTGFLGVVSRPQFAVERQSITVVPGMVGQALSATAAVVAQLPDKMVGVYHAAFSDQPRDLEGPVSVVGVGRMAGEVSSGRLALLADGWGARLALLVQLLAGLNLALFVFNLIPLLPLDGGHAAGAIWEGLKRTVARLRGRPDPGYVDVAKGLPVAYAVGSMLLVMSLLLIYADIVNPVRLG